MSLPYMIETKLAHNSDVVIVNVSSGGGKSCFPNLSSYCASKFGIISLTERVSKEVDDKREVIEYMPVRQIQR